MSLERNISKKADFPLTKDFGLLFSRFNEYEKRQGTTYRGTQGILTSVVQAIRSFPQDLRNREPNFSI